MCRSKVTRTVTVANCAGLHARAATLIAELVRPFDAKVELAKGCQRVEAVDVLQVLSLGVGQGEELVLEATGEDADSVLEDLVELFASRFGDDEPSKEQEA